MAAEQYLAVIPRYGGVLHLAISPEQKLSGQAISNSGKNRRMKTILLLIGLILANTPFAGAQQPAKIPRIGYVSGTGDAFNQGPYVEALRQGLKEHGYTDGKNIVIEYRGAEAKMDRVPNLVTELVQLKVDVLVVPILPAILAAKKATKTIPIVMVAGVDSVARGIVDSLARPGGNITGLNTLSRDLGGKRIQLLTVAVPHLLGSQCSGMQIVKPLLSVLRNTRLPGKS